MHLFDLEKLRKNVNDYIDGLYDTFVKAPYSFGDFVARVSGFRDYQFTQGSVLDIDSNVEQHQSINELKIIYNAIINETSRKMIIDAIIKDVQEKPAYYLGGRDTTNITGKTIFDTFIGQAGYKTSISLGKVDGTVHQLYEKGEMYINQNLNEAYDNKSIDDNTDKKLWEHILKTDDASLNNVKTFLENESNQENQEQYEEQSQNSSVYRQR